MIIADISENWKVRDLQIYSFLEALASLGLAMSVTQSVCLIECHTFDCIHSNEVDTAGKADQVSK